MGEPQKYVGWKKPDPRAHTVWFNLYEDQQQAKLIYGDRNQNRGCLGGGEVIRKEYKETS